MSNEGNTKQPTHAAYIRLVEQTRLFVLWYSTVFPAYYKQRRITKEEVYVLIRMYNHSISSLLSLLDQRVQQNKASQIPIDKPLAWSRAVVEKEIAHELERQIKLKRKLLALEAELNRVEVTEIKEEQQRLPEKASSKTTEQPRKPWGKQKPKPLPDEEWLARYRSLTPEQLRGLSVVSLEPLVEDDAACTGDEDKDIRKRAVARATGGVPVDMTPMELAAYKRMQERTAKSFDKEPEKPPTEPSPKQLPEYVWKENYRSTTKDEFMQTSETLKGMSVLTLSPAFLRGEVACTGDYNTDYKAFCADVRAFTDAMQAEFEARMSNPVR